MIYRCKHFKIEELVSPKMYKFIGVHTDKLWMIFDIKALITLDAIRDRYGYTEVNTWLWAGEEGYKYSGYREQECKVGALLSQHRFGRAFDVKCRRTTSDEIREDLRYMPYEEREAYRLNHIKRLEECISWVHFDTGNNIGNTIKFFRP